MRYNLIKLQDILLEDAYQEFFAKEQKLFLTNKPSYTEYKAQVDPILPRADERSVWLYNHHAAELAWEERKEPEAKKHIEVAMQHNNRMKNGITMVMDFIINKRGDRGALQQRINSEIRNPTEKKTAFKLLNNPKWGGTLT